MPYRTFSLAKIINMYEKLRKKAISDIINDLCHLSVYIAALYFLYDGDLDTFWTVFIILAVAACIFNRIKELYNASHKSKQR